MFWNLYFFVNVMDGTGLVCYTANKSMICKFRLEIWLEDKRKFSRPVRKQILELTI